jgi:beta-lactamase regulating signal transducer with metallopeptidase domain
MLDDFAMFHDESAHRLAWTLFHFVWQGIVIGTVFALGRYMLRRRSPNARYLLGCLCLLLMAGVPLVTYGYLATSESDVAAAAVPPIFSDLYEATVVSGPMLDRPSIAHRIGTFLERFTPWLTSLWMLGVFLMAVRQTAAWCFLRRVLKRTNRPVSQSELDLVARLRRKMRLVRYIDVFRSELVDVPATLGWIRPAILLPPCALTGLSYEHLEALIAHELAHIRRHDFLVAALQNALETVLFFHPAVWLVSNGVRADREECCDAAAATFLDAPERYAEALIVMEEVRFSLPSPVMSAGGGSLTRRIGRLLGDPQQKLGYRGRTGLASSVLALVAAGLIGSQLSAGTFVYQQVRGYRAPRSLADGIYNLFAAGSTSDTLNLSASLRPADPTEVPDDVPSELVDALFQARPEALRTATLPHARAHAGPLIEGSATAGRYEDRQRLRSRLLAQAKRHSHDPPRARRDAVAALLLAAQDSDLFGSAPVSAVLADGRFSAAARLDRYEADAIQTLLREHHAASRAFTAQLRRAVIATNELRSSPSDAVAKARLEDALALLRVLSAGRYDTQWFEARFYASALPTLSKVEPDWAKGLLSERTRGVPDPHVLRWFDEVARSPDATRPRARPGRVLKPEEFKLMRPLSR